MALHQICINTVIITHLVSNEFSYRYLEDMSVSSLHKAKELLRYVWSLRYDHTVFITKSLYIVKPQFKNQ